MKTLKVKLSDREAERLDRLVATLITLCPETPATTIDRDVAISVAVRYSMFSFAEQGLAPGYKDERFSISGSIQ